MGVEPYGPDFGFILFGNYLKSPLRKALATRRQYFEVLQDRIKPKSGPEGRAPDRKHYLATSNSFSFLVWSSLMYTKVLSDPCLLSGGSSRLGPHVACGRLILQCRISSTHRSQQLMHQIECNRRPRCPFCRLIGGGGLSIRLR